MYTGSQFCRSASASFSTSCGLPQPEQGPFPPRHEKHAHQLSTPRKIQMKKLPLPALAMLVLVLAGAAHAQFSLLYNLGTNAGDPTFPTWVGNFVQGRDGNLYSTSPSGGSGVYPYEGTV